MKRALVTGATGFIGSRLCATLHQMGFSVHALVRAVSPDKNNFTSHRYDGRMASLSTIVDDVRPDVVFHLAALASYDHSPSDIDAMVDANIRLGVQLAEACSQRGKIVFINVGTFWQNGQGTSRYEPVSLYAAMKQAFQDIAVYYARSTSLRVATLRFFDVYGPNDPRGKLLAQLDDARIKKTPLPLSPGKQSIDMVHIDDAVAALIHAVRLLESKAAYSGATWSVSSGKTRTLREIVALYCRRVGAVQVVWGGRPYRPREVMRPWRGQALPGWKPRISLTQGFSSYER